MIYLLLFASVVAGVPVENDGIYDPMQNPGLFGGDMLGINRHDKNAIPYFQQKWPAGDVPYLIDESLEEHRAKILEAMKHYETHSCVRFIPKTVQRDYIKLFSGKGCYSHVGMVGGKQLLSLGRGCIYKGTIVHELGHALGFHHEQNRSDRDDYLIIHWDNIKKGFEEEFDKLEPHQNILYTPFDYDSVMLYGDNAFSKDNSSITMEAKTGVKLYHTHQKPGLSPSDIIRVNKMYWCDEPWQKNKKF